MAITVIIARLSHQFYSWLVLWLAEEPLPGNSMMNSITILTMIMISFLLQLSLITMMMHRYHQHCHELNGPAFENEKLGGCSDESEGSHSFLHPGDGSGCQGGYPPLGGQGCTLAVQGYPLAGQPGYLDNPPYPHHLDHHQLAQDQLFNSPLQVFTHPPIIFVHSLMTLTIMILILILILIIIVT